MDQRQTQITEGAGQIESRLNTEFIDWLNKWGSAILMVVLIAALGWIGWQWWERRQTEALNQAFVEYDGAYIAGRPEGLIQVAEEWDGRAAIYELSLLRAADVYLESFRQRIVPGGSVEVAEDKATPEMTAEFLTKAKDLYTKVFERARKDPAHVHQEFAARSGLISVAIAERKFDEARALLTEMRDKAREQKLTELAAWTEARLETFDDVASQPPLHPEESLAAVWSLTEAEAPAHPVQQPGESTEPPLVVDPESGSGPPPAQGPAPPPQ